MSRAPEAAEPPTPEDTRVDSPEWRSYGHDLFNTRSSPAETKIGVDNAARLTQKWAWTRSAVTSTPVFHDGRIYVVNWLNEAVALEAATGKELWHTALPNQPTLGQLGSPAVTDDAVYVGGDNSVLVRIDRQSGELVWSAQVDEDGGAKRIYASPVIIDDLVIVGVASWQNINVLADERQPFRGSLVARRLDTGAPVWRVVFTETTGVGIVSSPAVDPARKLLFLGTGQNYSGDSPYADSLVAIDYSAGKIVWNNQFKSGDIYSLDHLDGPDMDVLASPVLYTLDGVDMVAAANKGGLLRACEREGKQRWSTQLTQGGHTGGVMGSSAYAERTHFVCSGEFATDVAGGTGQNGPTSSQLFAVDAADGSVRWKQPIDGNCFAAVSYANGVVYLPTGQGELRAFDASDGSLLVTLPLGGSSAGGVSIVDGVVYVSYGWDWILPAVPGGVVAFGLP